MNPAPSKSPYLFCKALLAGLALGVFFTLCLSAQNPLPEPGAFTPEELIAKANAAFQSGDFQSAEALFLAFERDFGEEADYLEVVKKNCALIALCMITNGRTTEAGPYIEKALQLPDLPRDIAEELSFWYAIQLLQNDDYRNAQEALGKFFQQRDFTYARRLEALTLFGACYMLQNYHKTAAEFFNHQIPNLRKAPNGESYAARAVVMEMISYIESKQFDEAFLLLKREYPNMGRLTQIVSFQTLALTLGSHYMEQENYYAAIACLQRIWPRQRLLRHQEEKLAELKSRRESLTNDPRAQSALFVLDGAIKRIERELENFQKIENFDAALRLRLAMAFQRLERYREAALIMEDMLQKMEKSPVVESASLAVIQCWSQLERWPKALRAAENYLIAFGEDANNKNLPQVLFMQADAMMQMQQNSAAESVFANIARTFPDHSLANKAIFMSGFCQLLQDENDKAIASFDQVLERVANSSLGQDAFYWKGMAYSFSQRYSESKEHMGQYLEKYKDEGLKYEAEANFRRAYCTFCDADYPGSIDEFREYLVAYGQSGADRDEAHLLLGDALLGEGFADEGIAAYAAINPASTRFFEDGYFKTGKAYKLLEQAPTMRAHYERFLLQYPDSKKMPEAVYWIGWTHVHNKDLDKAKEIYWKTILEHGDKAEFYSIEELLLALPKVYKRSGPGGLDELERDLQSNYLKADRDKKKTLTVRMLWADAMLKQQRNEINQASALLIRLAALIDPEHHNPQIVADVADALAAKKDFEKATHLYKELRKWNPISFHKARAYKGLGKIAALQGKNSEAIDYYRDYEKAAASSTDLAEIVLERIGLETGEGTKTDIKAELESLLENPAATTEHKAKALFLIGEHLAKNGEYEKATAYFERVYVVYGKYRELVAKAYYRRGEILEKMGKKTAAYEVYAELGKRSDLEEFRESELGRRKTDLLKEFAPPPEEADPEEENKQ